MHNIFVEISDLDITKKLYEIRLFSNAFGKDYTFYLSAFDEQNAIDIMIDYCENNIPGLIMSRDEEVSEEYIDEFVYGGNYCRYMNILWCNMELKKIYEEN